MGKQQNPEPADRRTKPIRLSVDLDPDTYRALERWKTSCATVLDVPRLGTAEVIRAMIEATLDKPQMAGHVTRILKERLRPRP